MVGWWMAGTGDGLLTGRSGGWNSTSGSTDRFDGKVRTKLSYSNKLAQGWHWRREGWDAFIKCFMAICPTVSLC